MRENRNDRLTLRPYDEALLRHAFDVASRSRAAGDHPFGSVLADSEGRALMEQGNGYTSEGGDRTAHAERLLASRAARAYGLDFLARCTLYTSAEPCAMCAGAIYWAGIGRVVYGQTEKALKAQTGAHEENPTLDLPCAPRVRRRSTADRGRRPAARGRSGSAAGGFLEGEGIVDFLVGDLASWSTRAPLKKIELTPKISLRRRRRLRDLGISTY